MKAKRERQATIAQVFISSCLTKIPAVLHRTAEDSTIMSPEACRLNALSDAIAFPYSFAISESDFIDVLHKAQLSHSRVVFYVFFRPIKRPFQISSLLSQPAPATVFCHF